MDKENLQSRMDAALSRVNRDGMRISDITHTAEVAQWYANERVNNALTLLAERIKDYEPQDFLGFEKKDYSDVIDSVTRELIEELTQGK